MEHTEHTRRDFIKKGAMVGGVAWAAPTILSVGLAPAHALYQCCPNCDAAATGLRVKLPLVVNPIAFGVSDGPGEVCNPVTATGTVINAGVACGSANDANCTASGELVGNPGQTVPAVITIGGVVISATVLRGEVHCGPNGLVGSSTITGLTVNGQPITLASNCQLVLNVAGVRIAINEQTCNNGRLTVRALHASVDLAGAVTDVVAGEATAGAPGCKCVAAPVC